MDILSLVLGTFWLPHLKSVISDCYDLGYQGCVNTFSFYHGLLKRCHFTAICAIADCFFKQCACNPLMVEHAYSIIASLLKAAKLCTKNPFHSSSQYVKMSLNVIANTFHKAFTGR